MPPTTSPKLPVGLDMPKNITYNAAGLCSCLDWERIIWKECNCMHHHSLYTARLILKTILPELRGSQLFLRKRPSQRRIRQDSRFAWVGTLICSYNLSLTVLIKVHGLRRPANLKQAWSLRRKLTRSVCMLSPPREPGVDSGWFLLVANATSTCYKF